MIIRKEALDKYGGFDEKLFFGDRDLGWRLRLCGYKMATALQSVCYHFGSHALGLFPSTTMVYYDYRDVIRVFLKNYSLSRLVKRLLLSLAIMFLISAYYTLKFRELSVFAVIRAVSWNIRNLRDTMKERSKIQKARVVSDSEIEKHMVSYPFLIYLAKMKLKNMKGEIF